MSWKASDIANLRIVGGTGKRAPHGVSTVRKASDDHCDTIGGITRQSERQGPANGREASVRVQRLRVPAIGPSINQLYGMHPMRRSQVAKQFKAAAVAAAREQDLQPVGRYPVTVHVVCHFGPDRRRFDYDNLALTAKFIGDGLTKAGILQNDSPPFVSMGTLEPRKTDEPSYTEYFIYEPINEG